MRGIDDPSKSYPKMRSCNGEWKKMYVEHPRGRSKLNYFIHGNGIYSPDWCKLINNFGTRCSEGWYSKYIIH